MVFTKDKKNASNMSKDRYKHIGLFTFSGGNILIDKSKGII